jgi:hypothetical protein
VVNTAIVVHTAAAAMSRDVLVMVGVPGGYFSVTVAVSVPAFGDAAFSVTVVPGFALISHS